jgi:hypothetical protein
MSEHKELSLHKEWQVYVNEDHNNMMNVMVRSVKLDYILMQGITTKKLVILGEHRIQFRKGESYLYDIGKAIETCMKKIMGISVNVRVEDTEELKTKTLEIDEKNNSPHT